MYLIGALEDLSRDNQELLAHLIAEPWFADGLDNEELVFIVGVLNSRSPELVLSPYSVQHRAIELPLAGRVNLWAARNGRFDPQIDVLAKMEKAIRGVEGFWELPFRKQDVIAFVSDNAGFTNGRFMALGTDRWSLEDSAFYRQAAEFYFNYQLTPSWYSRAGHSLLISYLENVGVVPSVEFPVHCRAEGFNSHQELWDQGFGHRRHACWTDIGVHLLVTLHDTMGEEAWRSAFRSFYLAYVTEATNEGVGVADEYDPGSEDVYRAFIDNTPAELVDEVNAIFRRLDGGPYIDP